MTSRLKVIGAGLCTVLALSSVSPVQADALDDIGLNALLAEVGSGLNGDGIIVGMVEASTSDSSAIFQFNPTGTAWGSSVPVWFFQDAADSTYITNPVSPDANRQYNNAQESGHASGVAGNYASVASGVDKVEVFHADYFIEDLLANLDGGVWDPVEVQSRVISQSYIIDGDNQPAINSEYNLLFDAYANQYGTFFVSGVQNSQTGVTYAPGAMYNGITVGNKNGSNSLGVHLVAPQDTSSNATPMVAGAAALLLQAAEQSFASDAGAADNRVLKALLINGASKNTIPAWGTGTVLANGLDQQYGAGMLNVYNSYKTLMAGRLVTSTTASPILQTKTTGWDLQTLAAGTSNSYFFEVPSGSVAANTLTATLTWNSITTNVAYAEGSFSGNNQISDFNLGLWYLDETNGWELVTEIDAFDLNPAEPNAYYLLGNVAHLYLTDLEAGTYELRVTLEGVAANSATSADTYAIAYSLGQVPEPSTAILVCLGAACAALRRRRKRGLVLEA